MQMRAMLKLELDKAMATAAAEHEASRAKSIAELQVHESCFVHALNTTIHRIAFHLRYTG